jgi:hypothetical protein
MKVLGWKAVLALILSTAAWWALYVTFPAAPPDAADTSVIVGFMLVVVLGTSSLIAKVRKSPAASPAADAEAPAGESAS